MKEKTLLQIMAFICFVAGSVGAYYGGRGTGDLLFGTYGILGLIFAKLSWES